ncbi:MAG: sulfurtransferase TusA family protein [Magnetococcales bacterium]|nr:sulfurtransferase TusA family protein [Magnetococcales bacterium]
MADAEIDITGEVCPMTFVKIKLTLETMLAGQVLVIRLRGDEPLRNIPRTLREDGHRVSGPVADGDAFLLEAVKGW